MWSLEDVSERQVVKCPCLAASYCRLSELVDCGQLNPTELLRCSYLNLAIPTRMTMQKTVTVSGHCGQCHELYLATACPSACNSRSFRFDPSTVWSVRALWGEVDPLCIKWYCLEDLGLAKDHVRMLGLRLSVPMALGRKRWHHTFPQKFTKTGLRDCHSPGFRRPAQAFASSSVIKAEWGWSVPKRLSNLHFKSV